MSAPEDGRADDGTSGLAFRNVDADVDDPVETWFTEAVEAALDCGGLPERRRIAAAIRREPWGPVATTVESILTYARPYGVDLLMEWVIAAARSPAPRPWSADQRGVHHVARGLLHLREATGVVARACFARATVSPCRETW